MLSELDTEKGIGLIQKQRQDQGGKPTKIYVKSFIVNNFSKISKGQGNNTEFSDTNLILSLEVK